MTPPKIETPRGSIIINKNAIAELKWNTSFLTKKQRQFSAAQRFVDSEVLRLSEKYIPLLIGILIKSGILGTVVGSGLVEWIAPYAHYQYYGKVMSGTKPKVVTEKNLTYHGGGLRGSFWFERMKAVDGKNIIAGARRIAGGG